MPSECSPDTSLSLLDRVRTHDQSAWKQLAELYGPLIYSWSRRAGVTPDESADVMQEVFRAVHRAIGGFRREHVGQSFRGWLWTITRNKCNDLFRQKAKMPIARGGTEANLQLCELPISEPADSIITSPEIDSRITRCLDYVKVEFRKRTWQAFWLCCVEGRATDDVAAELEMSTGAVRKARFRVLHRLREELQGLL